MTCQEIQAIMLKNYHEATVAERSAVRRHAGCPICIAWSRRRCNESGAKLPPQEREEILAKAAILRALQIAQDQQDPEY